MKKASRREFLAKLARIGVAATLGKAWLREIFADETAALPRRPLGKTGLDVSIFALGCGVGPLAHRNRRTEAVEIMQRALELGVNYFDTAASYGSSEEHLGEALAGKRREVILATKTHDRTRDGSWRLLEQSLKRLRTDHLDVWQIHNTRPWEGDVDEMFARDGVIRAMEEAREQKIVRFVGVTGHRSAAMVRLALERYHFDVTLIAINAADRKFEPFLDAVVPLARRKNVGVLAMKIPAYGKLLRPRGPLSVEEAVGFVLSQPVSAVVIGCDSVAQLEENVSAAREFREFSREKLAELETRAMKSDAEDVAWYKLRW
jgi:aryl-alcohol dehydrogenase-like predicted oxidoreductase